MFTGDTKNRQRSGQTVGNSWHTTNLNAGAQQHTTGEAVAAQDTAMNAAHRRPLMTPVGGGGPFTGEAYDYTHAYNPGNIVWQDTQIARGSPSVTIIPAIYLCIVATSASPTGANINMIPQIPLPVSGTVYWRLLGFAPQDMGICGASGSGNVYVQASGSFGV